MSFFHKLFNPHCEHCQKEQNREVEFLRFELEKAQRTIEHLMSRLIDKPVETRVDYTEDDLKPLLPRSNQAWRAKRIELETESRKLSNELLAKKNKELEKEVLGKEQEDASGQVLQREGRAS